MKLKIYNKTNSSRSERSSLPAITLNRKGFIRVSKAAAALFETNKTPGFLSLSIAQDEENQRDWFVKTDAKDGITFRAHKTDGSFMANSSKLANDLIDSMHPDRELTKVTLKVASKPADFEGWYPLFTHSTQ